jgi:hypothetical protein
MSKFTTKFLFGCQESYSKNLGYYIILFGVQLVYTIVVWATFLNRHFINNILMLCMFPLCLGSMFVITKFVKMGEDEETPQ